MIQIAHASKKISYVRRKQIGHTKREK